MVNPPRVQPRLDFIPPRFTPWVLRATQLTLPLLLRVRLRSWLPAGIRQVKCQQVKNLADYYAQFQQGKVRLILAFRHSEVDDPLSMAVLFARDLPRVAQQQGITLKPPLHSHFMYDRGMPLWAGRWLGWFFSRLGGIPVHRGRRLDLKAIKAVRERLVSGKLPLSIAPEGATNGHGEVVSPLEPGAAQLAFWCLEDLKKAGRSDRVVLLPIGLQYQYPDPNWAALNRLMSQLETDVGLPVKDFADPQQAPAEAYYERLNCLSQHLLVRMEQFYQRFFQRSLAQSKTSAPSDLSAPTDGHDLAQRLERLLHEALTVGEQFFGLPSTGSPITRCRRLEEAGWAYTYREDIDSIAALPPVERGLANWVAEAASLHTRHMRLVESFVAVTGHYVKDKPSFERFAETTLILFDLVERLKGTKVPSRPRLGWRDATLTVGEPIDVSERWPIYSEGHRAAKQAVETLTQDLQGALEGLIF
ncbi:1-acyl-sn-glycerol-3-phosphate acyltransferase [Pseudanabaena sp. FACHB-2040]|uniref:lysophospholipid acyltransferase family protein n=1 Tax=Pseudanabaena sp. FACHB-2040 TaxID=2692859 RepID=UPI0016825149|nr:1-acyl-sn-glycerol-3-phosphate acyltransferase [Pseudanabaena sp. FACHB-2040]MBD2256801.1 1-acyl-sn-glycerol-3-phosphate acyltransferase [Pseudanabaena sp. FACHB-2040]